MKLALGLKWDGTIITSAGEPNDHLFVSGISGSGKSYCLKVLTEQAVRRHAQVIVFDYTGDYRAYVPPGDIPFRRVDVREAEFQVNPLAATPGASTFVRTQRLINVLCTVNPRMGVYARLALLQHVPDYLEACSVASIPGLLQHLKELPPTKGIQDACELLAPLEMLTGGCGESISLDLRCPGLVVLDFTQVETGWMRRLLVEVILRAIWDKRVNSEPCFQQPLILLLDECQELGWHEDGMAVRILREGRKFQIAGWFSTQWISSKTAAAALKQAGTQLYFRQHYDNAMEAAKALLGNMPEKVHSVSANLSSLSVGDFIMCDGHGRPQKGHVIDRSFENEERSG